MKIFHSTSTIQECRRTNTSILQGFHFRAFPDLPILYFQSNTPKYCSYFWRNLKYDSFFSFICRLTEHFWRWHPWETHGPQSRISESADMGASVLNKWDTALFPFFSIHCQIMNNPLKAETLFESIFNHDVCCLTTWLKQLVLRSWWAFRNWLMQLIRLGLQFWNLLRFLVSNQLISHFLDPKILGFDYLPPHFIVP